MTRAVFPAPPTFTALEAWAGAGRVIRADESELTAWPFPEQHKAILVSSGVPLLEGVIDTVSFTTTSDMYRLAGYGDDRCGSTFTVQQGTGRILELPTAGSPRLVNSSIAHWLCSLHLVGRWLTGSTAIRCWTEDEAMEQRALTELADLLKQITRLDPPAHGHSGDHRTHFWPAVLDRWLY